ncbi:hypothetical protein BsWGS_26624 [Bradybaena similaris]
MASRRKSAKPTNKVRRQVEVDDDDDEDEENMEEAMMTGGTPASVVMPREARKKEIISYIHHHGQGRAGSAQPAVGQSTHSPDYLLQMPGAEPHIALPSDIYQDFEALKSATRLDTTELMRKLLKGYQRVASTGQPSRDRKLDDVIDDLFLSKSASVLDLSKRNGSSPGAYTHHQEGKNTSLQALNFTDDQLAMGILDTMDVNDDNSGDIKPLDLTLHKKDTLSSLESGTSLGIPVKTSQGPGVFPPPLNCPATSNEHPHCTQSFKHAGSYVINLEPRNNSPSFANSSLAQVLQMDIPLHSFSKIPKQSVQSPESVPGKEGSFAISPQTSSDSSGSNAVHFRSKLFHGEKPFSPINKKFNQEMTLGGSSFSSPPSYAEAVTSVLNSQQSKRASGGRTSESLSFVQNVSIGEHDSQSGSLPFVHINADDSDTKFIPFTITPQLAPSSSHDIQRQQNLLQHLLQNQIKSETKPSSQLFHQAQLQNQLQTALSTSTTEPSNSASSYCNPAVSHVPMLQMPELLSDLNDMKNIPKTASNSDTLYPNFLLESNTVGIPSMSTALASSTLASSTLPNTSVPLSTFFMTTSANGGVGHMVAIPLIHAVSDGVTGFQPFAFAPHPIPAPSTSSTPTSSADVAIASALASGPSRAVKQTHEMANPEPASSVLFTSDLHPSPLAEVSKPKPGRPRGRGARGNSQKSQNKDMKLLTENTLFPGVYTSILKLPWSRRSRNKTKVKDISELKKQAQIIAHSKVNEDDDSFIAEGHKKEEEIEAKDINKLAFSDNMLSRKIIENQTDSQPQLHDETQRHLMQQQKIKDLEQQQRLHLQYHLRLQEEQRKLTKQIEQSYINMSADSALPLPFAASNQQILQGKQDTESLDNTQNEVSNLPVSMSNSVVSDSISFSQPVLSKDGPTVVYSSADANTPKKTPRKRGRPPKVPNLSLKTSDSHLPLNTSSLLGHRDQYEPENFLHTDITSTSSTISATATKPPERECLFPNALSASETDVDVCSTNLKSENTGDVGDNEMTLEKKISFLTNQIGLELTKSGVSKSSGGNTTQAQKCTEGTGNYMEDMMFQEMKMAVNKSLIDIKPRRKKVSRLLKSDENFMYATFKIKPKGLTPRKSRRRRKDVLANTAAVAETIANLRQKTFHDCLTPSSTSDKPLSMVAWKFHEQYPFTNEEEAEDDHANKDNPMTCLKCGSCSVFENDGVKSHYCQTCLLEDSEVSDHKDDTVNNIRQISFAAAEMKTEVCVTCGSILQKHFSDPSVTCDLCRNNSSGGIKASKLFSFQDSPEDTSVTGRLLGTKSATAGRFLVSSTDPQNKSDKCVDKSLTKINNNHLFCSQCRMVFTKICDYLAHSRDTHETKQTEKKGTLSTDSSSPNDLSRKPRVSKTKKSLAHKTLTCPVEECPHFFREQKDLDLHFMKKHSNVSTFPQGDCGFSYTAGEESDNSQQLHQISSSTTSNTTTVATTVTQLSRASNRGTDSLEKVASSVATCEKPLQCEFCDYRCRQKNALTWHMRKHPEAASQYRRYNNVNVD